MTWSPDPPEGWSLSSYSNRGGWGWVYMHERAEPRRRGHRIGKKANGWYICGFPRGAEELRGLHGPYATIEGAVAAYMILFE